jgi:hypothetical protein
MPVSHSVGCQVAQQQQHRVERSRMEIVMNYSYWRPERLVFTDAAERRAPRTTVAWDRVVFGSHQRRSASADDLLYDRPVGQSCRDPHVPGFW